MRYLPLIVIALSLVGCTTVKQLAPNSWNVTVYSDKDGYQQLGIGVSGALPFGKQ